MGLFVAKSVSGIRIAHPKLLKFSHLPTQFTHLGNYNPFKDEQESGWDEKVSAVPATSRGGAAWDAPLMLEGVSRDGKRR